MARGKVIRMWMIRWLARLLSKCADLSDPRSKSILAAFEPRASIWSYLNDTINKTVGGRLAEWVVFGSELNN